MGRRMDGCCRSCAVLPSDVFLGTSADSDYLLSMVADKKKIMREVIRQSVVLQLPADTLRA